MLLKKRDVAQPGSASVLGTEGCRFKSYHPDTQMFKKIKEYIKFLLEYYKSNTVFFLFCTTINFGLFAFGITPFLFFFMRQIFIILLVVLKIYLSDFLQELTRESDEIKRLVLHKEPRLRVLSFFPIIVVPSFVICFQEIFIGTFLHFLALVIINMWLMLNIYYMYIISTIPEARSKYNVRATIEKHGFRSQHTAKAAYLFCKECFKVGGVGVASVYMGDKMLYGPLHRSTMMNHLAAPFNGNLKSDNEAVLSAAKFYLDRYPQDRDKFIDAKGWIMADRLPGLAAQRGLELFNREYIQTQPRTWGKIFAGFMTGTKKDD